MAYWANQAPLYLAGELEQPHRVCQKTEVAFSPRDKVEVHREVQGLQELDPQEVDLGAHSVHLGVH